MSASLCRFNWRRVAATLDSPADGVAGKKRTPGSPRLGDSRVAGLVGQRLKHPRRARVILPGNNKNNGVRRGVIQFTHFRGVLRHCAGVALLAVPMAGEEDQSSHCELPVLCSVESAIRHPDRDLDARRLVRGQEDVPGATYRPQAPVARPLDRGLSVFKQMEQT